MAETLIHEATHLNAFLCEMLHAFYTRSLEDLAAPDARVLSAVRIGELRPLDKALHSALVAVPLMYFQRIRGESSLVALFSDSLVDCAMGLQSKRDFFTDYGWTVVRELSEFATTQDYDLVREGLQAGDARCLAA